MQFFKKTIHTLQTSNEATKKKFVFIFSAICMVLLIISWVFYLSVTLPKDKTEETTTNTTLEQGSLVESGDSHWKTLKRGFSVIMEKFNREKDSISAYSKEMIGTLEQAMNKEGVSETQNMDIIGEDTTKTEAVTPLFETYTTNQATGTPSIVEATQTQNELLFPTE
jgi:uncharacterized protein YpmB